MIDRKISNKELSEKGLVVDGVEILPPIGIETLNQLRSRRKISYVKIYGKIFYQMSTLIEWAKSKEVKSI
ncbi:MAG: hypothetical protein COA44_04610 [Arcobacter sp.]|nr:MAG: hypothetical protein COA44_04610 [Arcobacter sp.]